MRNLWRRQRWQMLPYSVFDSDGDEKRKKSPNLSGGFMKQKSLRAYVGTEKMVGRGDQKS